MLCGLLLTAEGSPDQVAEWLFPAMTMKIFGCLAQTELGHGSNVRGLLTTATYDPGVCACVLVGISYGCERNAHRKVVS